ncbi:MAG: (d)CMP kinase [Candidatus Dormibacteria bacterium]
MADPRQDRVVTVDGPAGSGKSTLGRRLSSALGLPFIDTGLFYRAVAAAAARRGLSAADGAGLIALAREARIDVGIDPARPAEVQVDGLLFSGAELHDPARGPMLKAVSGNAGVREALLVGQRAPAGHGAVAAGRDCGTIVFPGAALKLFLVADEDVRTARRATQLETRGAAVDVAVLDAEVRARDASDAARGDGPLQPATDSVVIDTGVVGIDEMVARALELCAERGLLPPPSA